LLQSFCDGYCDEAWVDTAASTNEVYDAASDCYDVTYTESAEISIAANDNQYGVGDSSGVEIRLAQSFTTTSAITASKVTALLAATYGTPTGGITCRIETDNAGSPSGTLVCSWATKSITPTASTTNTWTFPELVPLPTGTKYWIVWTCANQAANNYWRFRYQSGAATYTGGELLYSQNGVWGAASPAGDMTFSLYKKAVSGNISLQSVALEPDAQYDTVRVMLCAQFLDAAPPTLGTDLIVSASRDGGSTWTEVSMVDRGFYNFSTRRKMLYGSVSIADQPAGTAMEYKIVTANNKAIRFYGTAFSWE
jgi:hypothetical protein